MCVNFPLPVYETTSSASLHVHRHVYAVQIRLILHMVDILTYAFLQAERTIALITHYKDAALP